MRSAVSLIVPAGSSRARSMAAAILACGLSMLPLSAIGQGNSITTLPSPQGGVAGAPSIILDTSLPVVANYLFTMEKGADGAIVLSGYLPREDLKAYFFNVTGGTAVDHTRLASGVPASFIADAMTGFTALSALSEGQITYRAGTWSLSGAVADTEAWTAAERSLTASGSDWALDVTVPASDPPSTSASSGTDTGAATPSGDTPASSPRNDAPAASDQTGTSTPPPEAEPQETPAANNPAPEAPATGAEEVEAGPDVATPDAPVADPVPPVPPVPPADYAFAASKAAGSAVTLAGDLPAAPAIQYFATIAGGADVSGVAIEPGAPDGFLLSAEAGLRALTLLESGDLAYNGGSWTLAGRAADAQQRASAEALVAALPDGAAWSVDIGLPPALDHCREVVAALAARNEILFNSGSAVLAESSGPVLDELAADLALCPEGLVYVEGHTDSDGAEDLNLALSVSRAEAVVDALVARGVSADRLYAAGYGESLPVGSNETADGKRQNRRIAFTIVGEEL